MKRNETIDEVLLILALYSYRDALDGDCEINTGCFIESHKPGAWTHRRVS